MLGMIGGDDYKRLMDVRDEHPRSGPVLGSVLWLGLMFFEIESNRTN
jgi:hypothetical protein